MAQRAGVQQLMWINASNGRARDVANVVHAALHSTEEQDRRYHGSGAEMETTVPQMSAAGHLLVPVMHYTTNVAKPASSAAALASAFREVIRHAQHGTAQCHAAQHSAAYSSTAQRSAAQQAHHEGSEAALLQPSDDAVGILQLHASDLRQAGRKKRGRCPTRGLRQAGAGTCARGKLPQCQLPGRLPCCVASVTLCRLPPHAR